MDVDMDRDVERDMDREFLNEEDEFASVKSDEHGLDDLDGLELLDGLDDLDEQIMLQVVMVLCSFLLCLEAFQAIELSRENQIVVNPIEPVYDVLRQYAAMPQLFCDMTNFTLEEFRELCAYVVPIIESNAWSSGSSHILSRRPCKLSPEQRLLSCILYLKHDSIIYLDAARWNWSRSSVCDDALFVATCINHGIAHEIRWPTIEERRTLGRVIPQLPGCINFVDGTLCKIRRPFENEYHSKWYNGRKHMYCINSTVLVDHNGLFIYVDGGYPGSYHDTNILRRSWVEERWRELFENRVGYCEYLLGDQGYIGMEKYVMRGFSKVEIQMMGIPPGPCDAFNKMHSGYRIRVEWGIGGLKHKWRHLMKRFDLVKPKFSITFQAAALMTNFIHRRRRNMQQHIDGPRQRPVQDRGWAGDY